MSKLKDAVDKRLQELNEPEVVVEDTNKVFSLRLPIELIEKIDVIGSLLEMNKTEVSRMILSNGVDEIFQEYKITHESHGASYEEIYALETGEKTFEDILKNKEVAK